MIKGYKGFDKDLKCHDFQYEVGKEYECERAVVCKEGFHFCENPLDIFNYYAPSKSRFCKVEGSGEIKRSKNGDKVCCTKIRVIKEIGIDDLIKEGEKLNLSNIINNNEEKRSFVTNYEERSGTMVTNDYSIVKNKGYGSVATNVGDKTFAVNFSDLSVANNTGVCSVAVSLGKFSATCVEGDCSIAVSAGRRGKAKGAFGCWLVLTERGEWNGNHYPVKDVKVVKVDGKNIKPDTFYRLVDGKPVETD